VAMKKEPEVEAGLGAAKLSPRCLCVKGEPCAKQNPGPARPGFCSHRVRSAVRHRNRLAAGLVYASGPGLRPLPARSGIG
jgi:hypothetical protein